MFALIINDDNVVQQSWRCTLQDYRKDLEGKKNYRWVDSIGFLDPSTIPEFLMNPKRFVYLDGLHDYDGTVLGLPDSLYVKPEFVPLILSTNNNSYTVPDGMSLFLVKYMIAPGGAG